MSILNLNTNAALSPGHDIWFVCEPEQSYWATQIDWHINFQISRSKLHKSAELKNEVKEIIADQELELKTDFSSYQNKALLIYSGFNLPAKYIVKIAYNQSSAEWIQQAKAAWQQLNFASCRVFAHKDLDIAMLRNEFKNNDSITELNKTDWLSYIADN